MDNAEYTQFLRPYDRALQQLLLDLQFFAEDVVGLHIYSIQHRLKSFDSASEKAARLNLPITELQDLVGVRIVVAALSDVNLIARFFSKKEDSDDLVIQSDKKIERQDGYRARHLVLEYPDHRSREAGPSLHIEVQIQTLMQNACNDLSRSWVYRTDVAFSKEWRSEFAQLTRKLAELDALIAKLQNRVIESSVSSGESEPLTPFSYQRIVVDSFGEHVTIEDAIDSVRFLVDSQCDTNGKLKHFFRNPEIIELRKRFLKVRTDSGRKVAQAIAGMPLHVFFMTWGVRLEEGTNLARTLEGAHG